MRAQLLSPDVPVEIRQAAAVNFKNHVKAHWVGASLAVVPKTVLVKATKTLMAGTLLNVQRVNCRVSQAAVFAVQVLKTDDMAADQYVIPDTDKVGLL